MFQFQEGGNVADILQFVEVYLWSPDQCNAVFEDLSTQIDPITEICAYNEVKTCTFKKVSAQNFLLARLGSEYSDLGTTWKVMTLINL